MAKVITFEEAVKFITDGACIATSGIGGINKSMKFDSAIEERFLKEGHPRDLTVLYAAGQGGYQVHFGMNCYAHEGMLKRMICGHIDTAREVVKLALEGGTVEIYNLPQGQVAKLFRAIAAKEPGILSRIGLGTFIDPRVEGPGLTENAKEQLVEVVNIDEEDFLLYKAIPIDVAVIRGTTADTRGNISAEREAAITDILPLAMAAHNSGGIVIAEVQRLTKRGSLNPRGVVVPGALVDYIVMDEEQRMTFIEPYNPAYNGDIIHPEPWVLAGRIRALSVGITPPRGTVDIIPARRAAFELKKGAIVNIGLGIPEGVAQVAEEEDMIEEFDLTEESGPWGGVPVGGASFGASINPDAILHAASMFDFYGGGGLDITFVGFAEVDAKGNVNVSKIKGRLIGTGGFVDITQTAKKVVFLGKFANKAEYEIGEDGVKILKEGTVKFVPRVGQITFSADFARKTGQEVLYITERGVFGLDEGGLVLEEVAPGLDAKRDVLDLIPFEVKLADGLKSMDSRIFTLKKMNLVASFR